MIPVFLMDLSPQDFVLDMCAAPGSKTSQMLEIIESKGASLGLSELRGGVVANDMSSKRAWMLAHQLKRINTACMAVINHEGQLIPTLTDCQPTLQYDHKFYFD